MCFACFVISMLAVSSSQKQDKLKRFAKAYSEHIKSIDDHFVVWHDGTRMPLHERVYKNKAHDQLENPTLAEQIYQESYIPGLPANIEHYCPVQDSGRIRYEPFFLKMYGNSPEEVESHLVEVTWMPHIFGTDTYKLLVTTVNGIHKKIQAISDELEKLVLENPDYKQFLDNPGGTYNWRVIANTDRLSNHSFGMTIDINTEYSHYWQWDLEKAGLPIDENTVLEYSNSIPRQIVLVFEKYGFIWGGKWYHYDTMHFEYRPELFEYFYI